MGTGKIAFFISQSAADGRVRCQWTLRIVHFRTNSVCIFGQGRVHIRTRNCAFVDIELCMVYDR